MLKVSRYEWAKKILARLRRTPETPNETVVNAIRGIQHAAYAHSEGDNVVVGWLEIVDEWLATQDPNAGGSGE